MQGGAGLLAGGKDPNAWKATLATLTHGLRHMGFSSFATKELLILENELEVCSTLVVVQFASVFF